MAPKHLVSVLLVSGIALAAVSGWPQIKENPLPALVPQAAAQTPPLAPITEAQITEQLRARLERVKSAMAKAETPQMQAALIREFDFVSRVLATPAAGAKQATEDRSLLTEVMGAFALPPPEGAEDAAAALAAGNIARVSPRLQRHPGASRGRYSPGRDGSLRAGAHSDGAGGYCQRVRLFSPGRRP
ncbi:hypothetical protein [Pseudorhodobacter sp.]|uniref:hypothetical protein n=1 Tax=Pseudorhodobacter sp. TaxID=1934400 RepID=UPI002AFDF97C|nr:hypothetical protein [Pseudorhodobacter sp.]